MVRSMDASGWNDAGTRLPQWLRDSGFGDAVEGERPFSWRDDELADHANYAADVLESALGALVALPGADVNQLRVGLRGLRSLPDRSGASLGWVVHKSTGRSPSAGSSLRPQEAPVARTVRPTARQGQRRETR
jgi:hypothetical protein